MGTERQNDWMSSHNKRLNPHHPIIHSQNKALSEHGKKMVGRHFAQPKKNLIAMVGIGSNNPVITRSCSTSHLRPPVQGSLLKRLESTKAKAHVLDQTGTDRHGPLRAHWWIKLMYDDLPDLPIKNGVIFQCATLKNQIPVCNVEEPDATSFFRHTQLLKTGYQAQAPSLTPQPPESSASFCSVCRSQACGCPS